MSLLRGAGTMALVITLLAGCTTTPSPSKALGPPTLALLPPYLSVRAAAAGEVAKQVLAAQTAALAASGRYAVIRRGLLESSLDKIMAQSSYPRLGVLDDGERQVLAEAHLDAIGVTDVVEDVETHRWKVHFRVIGAAAGEVVETFETTLAGGTLEDGLAAWRDTLEVVHPPDPLELNPHLDSSGDWTRWWSLAPELTPEADRWKNDLLAARFAGDHAEALRLADLLIDKVAFGAETRAESLQGRNRLALEEPWVAGQGSWLRQTLKAEAAADRFASDLSLLLEALSVPAGTAAQEQRRLPLFLDLVRSTDLTSAAGSSPQVAAAFRDRFGAELRVMLTRPALVLVEGGTYRMGSTAGEADEQPVHEVTVDSFLMGRTEITQEQYSRVMGLNPSLFTQGPAAGMRPVERVSWYDAVEYCIRLSELDGLEPVYTLTKRNPAAGSPIKGAEVTVDPANNGYRLPSEAEWEWAARGGSLSRNTLLSGGGDPDTVAWTDQAAGGPVSVGTKEPNELGLYDLSGNVWEWCEDWYGKYGAQAQVHPRGPESGILKVGRGGSWHAAPWNARVTSRSYDNPGSRGGNIGFRVVRTLSPESAN